MRPGPGGRSGARAAGSAAHRQADDRRSQDRRRDPDGDHSAALLPAMREWSRQQPRRSRDALLFPAGDGCSPLNDSVLRDAHDKGKAAIGMPSLTIHGLRHTSATLAAQLGATIAELQARIGHSTPNMAMRYQHVAAERDAQLAARLSSHATGYTWNPPAIATAARQAESTAGGAVQSLLPGLDGTVQLMRSALLPREVFVIRFVCGERRANPEVGRRGGGRL